MVLQASASPSGCQLNSLAARPPARSKWRAHLYQRRQGRRAAAEEGCRRHIRTCTLPELHSDPPPSPCLALPELQLLEDFRGTVS
jgi:hypothetical protein